MEWEMFGVIASVIGLFAIVIGPILKFSSSVTTLATKVDQLSKDVDKLINRSDAVHDDIYNHIDNHEKRITILETKYKGE